jgi:hypothetical protein
MELMCCYQIGSTKIIWVDKTGFTSTTTDFIIHHTMLYELKFVMNTSNALSKG